MFQLICRILIALILITGTAIGKNYDNIIVVKKMSKNIKDGNTIITKSVSFEARTVKLKKDIFNIEDIGVISLHPNPASDYIEISLGSHRDSKGACPLVSSDGIAIYDVLGDCVLKSNSVASQTLHRSVSTTERIDISHLPRGVYFVKLGNSVKKFIKN